MCGRFVAFSSADAIADRLGLQVISQGARLLPPNWNVAPTNSIRIIHGGFDGVDSASAASGLAQNDGETPALGLAQNDGRNAENDGGLVLDIARWGLLPPWAKNGSGMINARIETVTEKPAFAKAFKNRRCIVPVDGYYEWQKTSTGKQPWFITGGTQQLYFAGIYNANADGSNTAILTMPTAPEIADIHHRMPVSFQPDAIEQWLLGSPAEAYALIDQADQNFTKWMVGTAVNNVRNNGPQLIEPVNPTLSELFLF